MKCKTYTFSEFFHREELSKLDIAISHIKKNKYLYGKLIVTLALVGFSTNSVYAIDFSKIDSLGRRGLRIVRIIGYWAIIIKGGSDIIGHAAQGDAKGAFRASFNYMVIFAILYLFPMMLDMVKEAFEG